MNDKYKKRIIISFSLEMDKAMQEMIDNEKLKVRSKREILRDSFVIYKYIVQEFLEGNKLCITDKKFKIIKEIIL